MAAPPPPYASINGADDAVQVTPEALPAYDTAGEETGTSSAVFQFQPSPGIDSKIPHSDAVFPVGDSSVRALVKPSELQAHLVLLGAFHRLREEVRTQKGKADIQLDPDQLWAVFLQRAVHRFEVWVTRVLGDGSDNVDTLPFEHVPPLDVIMVWHTYLLNPRNYYEDGLRIHKGLHNLGSFPLIQLASSIDQESLLPQSPSERRRSAWSSFTGLLFDPPLRTTMEDVTTVFCPKCSQPNSVPWITFTGAGYAQRGFSAVCITCNSSFDREALCVRKFCDDVEKCAANPVSTYLPYTLVDYHQGVPLEDLARLLTDLTIAPQTPGLKRAEELGKSLDWRLANVELYCRQRYMAIRNRATVATPRSLSLILSAYRQSGPFCLDLASAVLRQMSFVEKMVNFGWTEYSRFEEDDLTLTRSVVRYHAFLDLMKSASGKFIVPTLDIDLAWHTHQLLCIRYRQLHGIMGVVPDHNDKVTQSTLSTAYDDTAEAWKARFGVPYSVCGCLPPNKADSGISGLLSRVSFGKGKAKSTPPQPLENPRPDLISLESTAAETHPSEHNGVATINPGKQNQAYAQARRREVEKRAKDVNKKIEKGAVPSGDWADVQVKRAVDHTTAFLAPVKYGDKNPFGMYGQGDCAVYSGSGVKGEFAAGECVKGNGYSGLCAVGPEGTLQGSIRLSSIMQRGAPMSDQERLMYGTGMMYMGTGGFNGGSCGGSGCGGGCGGGGCGGGS